MFFVDHAQRAAVVEILHFALALELDLEAQLVLRVGVAQRILVGDVTGFVQIVERLVPREAGAGRIAAMEIMLNSPLIQDLIFKGKVQEIKEVMSRSTRLGMKTFDQSLFELYETGFISYEDALRNADSKNELRLRIKLESKREVKNIDDGGALKIVEEEQGRVI